MGRSQETFGKKEVRNKKEKKRKEKAEKRLAKKESGKKNSLDDMIAYVDENGMISDTPPEIEKEEINVEDISLDNTRGTDAVKETVKKGRVSFFNEAKGYGFIKDLKTKDSIFVHVNNVLEETIKEGDNVVYEVEKGPKGLTAVRVKKG